LKHVGLTLDALNEGADGVFIFALKSNADENEQIPTDLRGIHKGYLSANDAVLSKPLQPTKGCRFGGSTSVSEFRSTS
jgi:hypothetical protein